MQILTFFIFYGIIYIEIKWKGAIRWNIMQMQ